MRPALVWTGLGVAVLTGGWGVTSWLDSRPNPIRVTVGATAGLPMQEAAPPAPAVPDERQFVEVEVARERSIRMRVDAVPVAGAPPGAPPLLCADADATAEELRQLRGALDDWLAVPGRNLRVHQTWESSEFRSWFRRPSRVRIVLHARLVPTTDVR